MCQQRSNCDFPVLGGSRRRRVFGPEVGLPLLTGGSDLRNLWRPGGWHSAAENPIQLQEKKKTAVGLHENRVTWLETSAWAANLSWLFIHTQSFQPVQFHPSLHVSPLLFPFLQTHRRYLINQFFFLFVFYFIGTSGSLPAELPVPLRVRGSCWAIPRRHCFPLCLHVSKGNHNAKAL